MSNKSTPKPKKTKAQLFSRIFLIVAAVLLVAALIIGAVNLIGRDDDGDGSSEQATPAETTSPADSANEGDTPGAQLDSEQRSWPDPSGNFDDSQWSTPGEYSVDHYYNRPVFTPMNHDGDLPDTADLVENMDSCTDDEVLLDGKTQQQYVNARFLSVNSQSGPTTMNNDVPGGYAHSPQGAIIAALNQLSYGLYGQGDEVGEEIDKKLWGTSKTAQEELDIKLPAEERDLTRSRADSIPGPSGYEVTTCSDNVVVVDVANAEPEFVPEDDREGDRASKVTMVWRDGDWVPDFSGSADADIATARTVDAAEYTEVGYQ